MHRQDALREFLLLAQTEIKKLLRRQPERQLDSTSKEHAGDLVTAADLLLTELALDYFEEHRPGELLLSEEMPGALDIASQDNFTGWVLDPIDGTNNFARGIEYWGVSLAWVADGQPRSGGILTSGGDLLLAKDGQESAYRVSPATELGPATRVTTSNNLDYGETLSGLARYKCLPPVWVDCLGSAAHIFADIARGRLDLYHHSGLKPWDNPAGFLLVRQSGGVVLDFRGNHADWRSPEVVAGPAALVQEFLDAQAQQE